MVLHTKCKTDLVLNGVIGNGIVTFTLFQHQKGIHKYFLHHLPLTFYVEVIAFALCILLDEIKVYQHGGEVFVRLCLTGQGIVLNQYSNIFLDSVFIESILFVCFNHF